jgi:hypothetical protein
VTLGVGVGREVADADGLAGLVARRAAAVGADDVGVGVLLTTALGCAEPMVAGLFAAGLAASGLLDAAAAVADPPVALTVALTVGASESVTPADDSAALLAPAACLAEGEQAATASAEIKITRLARRPVSPGLRMLHADMLASADWLARPPRPHDIGTT